MKKKILTVALIGVLLLALSVPAAAVELSDLAEYANADAFLFNATGKSSTTEQGSFFSDGGGLSDGTAGLDDTGSMLRTLRVLFPVSIIGGGTYLFNYSFSMNYRNSTYASSWTHNGGSVIISYADGTTATKSISNNTVSADGFYAAFTKSVTSDSNWNVNTAAFSGSVVISDPDIVGFVVKYTGSASTSSSATGGVLSISTQPVSVINVSDATLNDVVTEVTKLITATESSSSSMSEAFEELNRVLEGNSDDQIEAIESATESLWASLDILTEAVNTLTDSMAAAVEEGTENALEKFYEKVKQEASDKLASALAQIQEAMPVDVVALQGSFDQLYQSMSTHEKTATMTFPAGDLTLMGQTYRFWEPQQISFDQYFELPGMSLLLIPLRFMFVFGMGKYLMAYFSKIEKLITLHTSGGGE